LKGLGRYKVKLVLTLVVAFGGLAAVLITDTEPNLGLDLEGGISVILTATGEEVRTDVIDKTVEVIRARIDALGVSEPEVSRSGDNILVQLPGIEDEQRALEVIGSTAQLTFRQVQDCVGPNVAETKRPPVTERKGSEVNDEEVVYPPAGQDPQCALYRLKPAELTGDVVSRAIATADPTSGAWQVNLRMNDEGAETWAKFTSRMACLRDEGEQVRSQVAIVLDGKVESATGMADPAQDPQGGVECGEGITGGESVIEVGGNAQEAKDLALVLTTGSLPITLERSEISKVSPTLGQDSLQAGITGGALGLLLVMAYMMIYYRALGVVVWIGLACFAASLFTLVAVLGEIAGLSLTLAGVAGLIVSIGVTADSYIVAFERLKDEIHSGKTLRAAVDRGMQRAFRTILVADFVTAAAAVILFFLAVGPVRGFALTLGLATLVDVLIAYYFTRSTVVLLSRTKLFTEARFIGLRSALGMEPGS
jgi:protein-export membrane protein SecD